MSKAANEKSCPAHPEAWQEALTARIIQDLKEGVPPWVKCWKEDRTCAAVRLPMNITVNRPYAGINVLALWYAALEKGYRTHGWLTYNQAGKLGARIKKGEKAEKIIFVDYVQKKDKGAKEGEEKQFYPVVKFHNVFNVDQCTDIPLPYLKPPEMLPPSEYKLAMVRFAHDTGVQFIQFGCRAACYKPSIDQIELPKLESFTSEDAFCGVLAHELIHASGHKDRLKRTYGKRFGDELYAAEELVAEIGSAFLCAHLGIPPTTRENASYIATWITVLENDFRAITSAASYASEAFNFLTRTVEENRAARLMAAE
ncbi:ArdC family protein [Methylobacterium sp. Gmos1]